MKKIGKVKMTMSKDMVVNVHADVHMKNANDKDDLYFVLFNIMADPLRLSIGTVGNFFESLEQVTGLEQQSLHNLLENQPDKYMSLVQQNYTDLVSVSSEEKVKIVLDNQRNADMARMVLSSLLQQGYYEQITTYHIGKSEPVVSTQKVPTESLAAELKVMLDISKKWEGFDLDSYIAGMGA
jgi:hypothetical protein|tara:strand:- start:25 stop:570 length:546 start_codon:yes stop_codon:yes gene_type:complete